MELQLRHIIVVFEPVGVNNRTVHRLGFYLLLDILPLYVYIGVGEAVPNEPRRSLNRLEEIFVLLHYRNAALEDISVKKSLVLLLILVARVDRRRTVFVSVGFPVRLSRLRINLFKGEVIILVFRTVRNYFDIRALVDKIIYIYNLIPLIEIMP